MSEIDSSTPLAKLRPSRLLITLAKGAGIAFFAQTAGTGVGYIGQILLARWMGTNEYGAYAYAVTWAQVLGVIAAFGLDAGVVRFIPAYLVQHDGEHLRGILDWGRRWAILAGALLAGLGSVAVLIFQPLQVETRALVLGLWLVPLLALSQIQTQMIRSTQQVALAYIPSMLLQPILVVGGAYLLTQRVDVLTGFLTICATALALLGTIGVQGWGIRRAFSRYVEQARAAYAIDEWLRVSFPLLLTSFFVVLLFRTDVLMIGFLLGPKEAGIYNAAAKTATVISLTLAAMHAVVGPTIGTLFARRDMTSLQETVRLATFWTFWPSLAIGLGVLLASGPILGAFGPEFMRARMALAILIIGQLVNVGTGPVGLLVSLTGYERQGAYVFGWSAAINWILCAVAVPLFGITGAALATSTTMVLWNIWLNSLVVEKFGIHASIIFATKATLFGSR